MGTEDPSRLRTFRPPRYEFRAELGVGAMGTVVRAWDRELRIEVALKRLFARADAEQLYLLKQEFRALRDISHRNLAHLYDLDVSNDDCFFTMELVEGPDFVTFVREESGPSTTAVVQDDTRLRAATLQLVEGLCAIHGAGKMHRDVKPSNVLVDGRRRVVLVDFGLVKDVVSPAGSASEHEFAGTFGYMAPELLLGRGASPASDWYSVGVMLFEALTGRLPFPGPPSDLLQWKRRPLTSESPELACLPPALIPIVRDLLDPDPRTRAGATALRHAFAESRTVVVPAATATPLDPGSPFVGRTRELSLLDGAFAMVQEGGSAIARVRGPSGIGKTELVRRFIARVGPETLVLRGRCHLRETVPHQALDAVVDELSRHLRGQPDAVVVGLAPRYAAALLRLFPVLGRVPVLATATSAGIAVEPQELRRQGIQALREILARLGDREPIVIWIDDAQWGDGDSALVLRELLGAPDAPRLLVVLSYRDDEPRAGLLVEATTAEDGVRDYDVEVAPLDPADTRTLVAALLEPGAPPSELGTTVDAMVVESGGSPFFVGELARVARMRAASDGALPSGTLTVADVVETRLGVLEDSSRTLLELVAVAGRPIAPDIVLPLARVEAGRRLVIDLSTEGLLRMHGGAGGELVEVYHDRIRDAVLNQLDAAARRDRHRQLAAAIGAEGRADPQLLVEHYLGAGEEALAAEHAVRAGEEAAAALAFERAAGLFGLAFRLRGARDVDWPLLTKRAEALANASRGSDAGETYEAAAQSLRRAAPDRNQDLRLRRLAGEQYLASGRLRQGVDVLWGVLRDLGVPLPASAAAARRSALGLRFRLLLRGFKHRLHDPSTIPRESLLRLDTLWAAGKGTIMLDAVLASVMSARHLAESLAVGDPAHLQYSLCVEAGFAASLGGRFLTARSREATHLAERLAARTDEPYGWGWVYGSSASVAYWVERWRDVVPQAERAIEIFTTKCTGAAWEATTLQTFLLASLAHLGRIRELTRRLPIILEDARRRGDLFALSLVRTGHTVLAPLAADDPDRALREADAMLAPFQSDHFTSQHFHHFVATVQAHLYAGEPWKAWEVVVGAWPALSEVGYLFLAALACQLRYLRAITALAAADVPPPAALRAWTPRLLERAAAKEARLLARASVASGRPRAAAIHAALAARRGDRVAQRAALVDAIDGFDRVEMALHADAARLQLAAIENDATSWTTVDARLRAEDVRNPPALVRTLFPSSPWALPSTAATVDVLPAPRLASPS